MADQHRPLETDGIEEAADEAGVTVGSLVMPLEAGQGRCVHRPQCRQPGKDRRPVGRALPNQCSITTAGPVPAAKYRTGRPSTVTTRSMLAAPAADPKSGGTVTSPVAGGRRLRQGTTRPQRLRYGSGRPRPTAGLVVSTTTERPALAADRSAAAVGAER